MSVKEVWQTITGTDDDARSLQSSVSDTKKKKTSSLPRDVHQQEFRGSTSLIVGSYDAMLNQLGDLGSGQRSRKATSKVLEYKISLLKEYMEKTFQIGK